MLRSISLGVATACFALLPATEGFAQHCQPYWTAQYKCADGIWPLRSAEAANVAPQPYVAPQPKPGSDCRGTRNAITAEGVKAEKVGNSRSP